MVHRRTFFKAGIAGALFLSGAYSIKSSFDFYAHPDYQVFDQADIEALLNIVPAVLAGAPLEDNDVIEVIKGMEIAILGLPTLVQKEISELFLLFKIPATRLIIGFNPRDIEHTKILLKKWKNHRTQTMRAAYCALSELINASYYARPKTWESIGYPNPLESTL